MLNSSRNHGAPRRGLRAVAASIAAVAVLGGTAACGESEGPEAGEVTTEDLQELEDRLGEIDDRVVTLEENGLAPAPEDIDDMNLADPALLGQEVTVSAAVSEVVTETDMGSAFRIGGDSGESVAVMSVNPPDALELDDVVRVTGTVTSIDPETFESDFGVAAEDLFDDPDAFFEDAEGQVALRADQLEVLEEEAMG